MLIKQQFLIQPVSKEIFGRWKTPIATPVNISDNLTAAEFAADLQNTKKGKAPPDSTCPKLII